MHAILVIDLAYGDCGKGTIVDALTRRHHADLIVRFNGGPQAGHNVITPDGRHHTFSQFGSGMFIDGVRTLLSRFMLIEPYALFNEADHLESVGVANPLDRLAIDGRCLVITPPHQAANRLRELARGAAAHGTCGQGVGEAMQDLHHSSDLLIRAAEMADADGVADKLARLAQWKWQQCVPLMGGLLGDRRARHAVETLLHPEQWISAAVARYQRLSRAVVAPSEAQSMILSARCSIFEGAQGVLLDENHGFHPHTTWSTTTFANAQTLLNESKYQGEIYRLGVLRTYFTRHGRGPFVTEDESLARTCPEPHNTDAGWQGSFRRGHFDAVAARYALAVCGGVDGLAITHLDRPMIQMCTAYEDAAGARRVNLDIPRPGDLAALEQLTRDVMNSRPVYETLASPDDRIGKIESELATAVVIRSAGPTALEKTFAGRLPTPSSE